MTAKEVVETLKQEIDLIEGQQAKINKLEKVRQKQIYLLYDLKGQKYELMNRISTVKNEAYKQFAGKAAIALANAYSPEYVHWIDNVLDNLLKELVGKNK